MQHTIHQIFFRFNGKELCDYPVLAASRKAARGRRGRWRYKLWDEYGVEQLCRNHYPRLWKTYRGLKYDIQRADLAKYLIADRFGGSIPDLDVLPRCHVSKIVVGLVAAKGSQPDKLGE